MYLERVHLKNAKCFADLKLKFGHSRKGGRRNWNVIVGDNGEGKTSLLRAIATCLLDRPAAERCLKPEGWVRRGEDLALLSVELVATDQDECSPPDATPHRRRTTTYGVVREGHELISEGRRQFFSTATLLTPYRDFDPPWKTGPSKATREERLEEVEFMNRNAFRREPGKGWLSCAYGAFRRLSGSTQSLSSTMEDPLVHRVATLFDEGVTLTNCESWLKELDRRALKSEVGSHRHAVLNDAKKALIEILPNVDEIMIGDEVELRFHGEKAQLADLSDGYRSMFALAVDILRWMEWARPDAEQPLREMNGVVLIDEVDAHLHPRWQREVGKLLTAAFPRIQFIVTSHSPFVAMAAGADSVTVLKQQGEDVKADQDLPDVRGWAVDQVLRELFELPSMRDPETADKLRDYQQLRLDRGAGKLDEKSKKRLHLLEKELNERVAPDVHGSWAMEQDLELLAEQIRRKNGTRRA